jgi:aminoglycoside/choline kinase family phosphotransferase
LYRANGLVSESVKVQAIQYAKNRRKIMRFLAAGPKTIVHHDCHPGNLFWDAQGVPGLLDWQMVRVGEGIGDVAYFLATALAPEVRRQHEMKLLAHYQDSLAKKGVPAVDTKALYQRYRAHLTYPFEAMVISQAIGGMMAPESNRLLIQRVAAAVEDHNAFAVVGT